MPNIERIREEKRIGILGAKPYFPLTPSERKLREMCVDPLIGKQPLEA